MGRREEEERKLSFPRLIAREPKGRSAWKILDDVRVLGVRIYPTLYVGELMQHAIMLLHMVAVEDISLSRRKSWRGSRI